MSDERGTGAMGAEGGADEAVDETIVVAQPVVDDATVVVAQPAPAPPEVDDATIVVAQPVPAAPAVEDATVVVAQPAPAEPVAPDATIVVAKAQDPAPAPVSETPQPTPPAPAPSAVDDSTMVVASPRRARRASAAEPPETPPASGIEDATIVVAAQKPQQDPAKPTRKPLIVGAVTDATMVSVRTSSRDPAPPVEEPDAEISARELAKLLFKPPLDPRRRVKESPFPQLEHTLPKRGVSQSMPVVYGARSEELAAQPEGQLDLEQRIGAPPATLAPPPVLREGLPSAAQLNRKFRLLALAGGAGVCVVVGLGLWGIAALAFG